MSVQQELKDGETIVRSRSYNAETKRWGKEWEVLQRRPTHADGVSFDLKLCLGGTVRVYPNAIKPATQAAVTNELTSKQHLFREYGIQGTKEPRAHFLLHEKATLESYDIDDTQKYAPGYRYGPVTMKGLPIGCCPEVHDLAKWAKKEVGVDFWSIGVDVVYYRGGNDKMGNHADNNQGETLILTALVCSPAKSRRIVFGPMPKYLRDGHKQFEMRLGAGDMYSMDGEMQEHYLHGIPADENSPEKGRIAIVFRTGTYMEYTKDSGDPVKDLKPRAVIPMIFGQMHRLDEGETYLRVELFSMGAHRSAQGGIGRNKEGCSSIVLAGVWNHPSEKDGFDKIRYAATSNVGAGAILKSMKNGLPIRVFRSSKLPNVHAPTSQVKNSARYRYDGLYEVVRVQYYSYQDGARSETITELPGNVSHVVTRRVYLFDLERIGVGNDTMSNRKSTTQIIIKFLLPAILANDA